VSGAGRLALGIGLMVMLVASCSCDTRQPVVPGAGREVPLIRVRLGDETPTIQVRVAGPWRLTGPGGGEIASGTDLGWTPVTTDGARVTVGTYPTAAGTVELHAQADGTLHVRQPIRGEDRERVYRGFLRVIPTEIGALRVVNVLPMEMYLAGVLTNEMPKRWHVEAFKAQAVAARSYALAEQSGRASYDFDVRDTAASQVYGGYNTETETAWEAVKKTWGLVATYRGAGGKVFLLKTYFNSTCGGGTVSAGSVFGGYSPPPLEGGVPCVYCVESPQYRWANNATIRKEDISAAIKKTGNPELVALGPIARVEVAETSGPGGRAEKIRMVDTTNHSVLMRAYDWRLTVDSTRILSTWFDIEDQGDRIVLRNGRGWGHGVGLCQWGAEYLAEHGKAGEEIVRFYYPGIELSRAY
jgi:stage II sporulation protein D